MVVDPVAGRNIGTIPLGGKPEFGVSAGNGKLYANITDKGDVVEIDAGRLVTTVPIGSGVDASAFDPASQLIFASNGDGTLSVVHEDTPDKYTVVATVPTAAGFASGRAQWKRKPSGKFTRQLR